LLLGVHWLKRPMPNFLEVTTNWIESLFLTSSSIWLGEFVKNFHSKALSTTIAWIKSTRSATLRTSTTISTTTKISTATKKTKKCSIKYSMLTRMDLTLVAKRMALIITRSPRLWKLQLWLSTKVINCSTCSWPFFPTQCYPRDFSFKLQIESSLTFDSVLKRSLFWVIYELGTSPRDISRTVVCW